MTVFDADVDNSLHVYEAYFMNEVLSFFSRGLGCAMELDLIAFQIYINEAAGALFGLQAAFAVFVKYGYVAVPRLWQSFQPRGNALFRYLFFLHASSFFREQC